MKKLIKQINKDLDKEIIIILGKKEKLILISIIIAIFGFLIPQLFIADMELDLTNEYIRICDYAKLEHCGNLERVYNYCDNARVWFEKKNCTITDNNKK